MIKRKQSAQITSTMWCTLLTAYLLLSNHTFVVQFSDDTWDRNQTMEGENANGKE